ncbi:MAG: preprotein translocase subunit SecY [Candidatus Woesearchaeota archaeon]
MAAYKRFLQYIPEVKGPSQKHLSFKKKLTWTGIILVLFFMLRSIPLFGLDETVFDFEFMSVVLGASFGSIITLGIGPIVTASIVLQLLKGSGMINIDTSTADGKAFFQGTQKILTYAFIILEAIVYVVMGGLTSMPGISNWVLILQIIIGGVIIVFMDDIINKWGFGQGVSLFIAAGVSQQIFIRLFSFLHPQNNPEAYVGAVWEFFRAVSLGNLAEAGISIGAIIATLVVFGVVVFAQAMKVEIPLSFGRIRGHGVRWPLNFIYTSVIPVILVSALVANLRLFADLLSNNGHDWLTGVVPYLSNTNLLQNIVQYGVFDVPGEIYLQSLTYVLFFIGASVLFSWFWMQTAGLDPRSQAKQMMSSGLQIPGFRKDVRVLERLLKRYIYPLTIMGGIFIGLLASVADMTGAIGSGTGLLLTVMIIYKLYEEIAKQHMEDMNPMMRKFMGK